MHNPAAVFFTKHTSIPHALLLCLTQVHLNWQRKSVVGLSFDFLALNFQGFICYSVYNVALLASPLVRAEYRRQMGGSPGVRLNDAIFAVHATVMTSADSPPRSFSLPLAPTWARK